MADAGVADRGEVGWDVASGLLISMATGCGRIREAKWVLPESRPETRS